MTGRMVGKTVIPMTSVRDALPRFVVGYVASVYAGVLAVILLITVPEIVQSNLTENGGGIPGLLIGLLVLAFTIAVGAWLPFVVLAVLCLPLTIAFTAGLLYLNQRGSLLYITTGAINALAVGLGIPLLNAFAGGRLPDAFMADFLGATGAILLVGGALGGWVFWFIAVRRGTNL